MHSEKSQKSGSIEVICGSMFSGKTEELIRRMRRAKFAKKETIIFKPSLDVRYAEKEVVSHNCNRIDSIPVSKSIDILKLSKPYEVIGIDEAQFFDNKIIKVCNKLANNGKRVIIAGLDLDFNAKPFGPMPELMAIADDVYKVHAICVKCGALANYSHRLTNSKELVMLGETDKYEPLCRDCYLKAIDTDKKLSRPSEDDDLK